MKTVVMKMWYKPTIILVVRLTRKVPTEAFTSTSTFSVKGADQFTWEKPSTGVASKKMKKMGHNGKGLGNAENGIVESIPVGKSHGLGALVPKKPDQRKTLCILSDSMLNQLDERKLSKKHDVKLKCHGGCTIACMYKHILDIIPFKADYILLHIGTNDCTYRISGKVLKELVNLVKNILKT